MFIMILNCFLYLFTKVKCVYFVNIFSKMTWKKAFCFSVNQKGIFKEHPVLGSSLKHTFMPPLIHSINTIFSKNILKPTDEDFFPKR